MWSQVRLKEDNVMDESKIGIALMAFGLLVLGAGTFNVYLGGVIKDDLQKQEAQLQSALLVATQTTAPAGQQAAAPQTLVVNGKSVSLQEFLPKGVPEVYGAELEVNFDKPVESLAALSKLDGDLYPDGKLKFVGLSDEFKQRYKRIGLNVACEYCCGATTLISSDGQPACGCAHSAAMRGLAMYMLKNHGQEFSDEQILGELVKWKAMFFPKQMYQKAIQLQGGSAAGTGAVAGNVPDMVGGC